MLVASVILFFICIVQNTSFSLVSRARNRDNQAYHAIASVFSNGVWFLTMKHMIDLEMASFLIIPYIAGTVTGSLTGARISMWIENLIGATSDGHLK